MQQWNQQQQHQQSPKVLMEVMGFVRERGFYQQQPSKEVVMVEEAIDYVPEKGFYQPSTDQTWESYQALFCVVEQQLGGYPRTVVCSVADEILGIFRNQYLTPIQKQFEVEKLIGVVSIDVFNLLVLSTNEIDDYNRARNRAKEGEGEGYFYQPRTIETWRAYNSLLNAITGVVQKYGVQQPHLVLCCAANELIAVLKNEYVNEDDSKKRVIGDILNVGYVSDQLVKDLIAIVELITDYKPHEHVGPTDLMSEDTLMMMMGEERKVKRRRVAYEDEETIEGMWQPSPWSDGEEEEEKPLVDDGDDDVDGVGGLIVKCEDDGVTQNENMGPVVDYHLVKDVKEKLVLNEEEVSEEDEEDGGWVVRKVLKKVMDKLVLNEVKKEDDDEWVVV